MHNPFTSPQNLEAFGKAQTKEEKLALLANAYDVVLNGSEIGGGSIRITDTTIQDRVFDSMGISQEEREANFG